MCRQSRSFVSLVVVLGLAASGLAADNYWWTNGSGDGTWNKSTPPYNWESVPAWNPTGPRVPCPPPAHGSASIYISGNPATRSTPLVIPAGFTADCTYGEEYGTIFGPEWGLHLDIYGSLTYRWYLVLAQGSGGLINPADPNNDPNRSVVNMYGGSRIHGTADSPGSDKTRAEGIAIGTNWWNPLPYVTMNMYEGSECLLNWVWIGGHLNMYGGTFDVLSGVNMGIGTPENVPDNLIRVDIYEGKLILPASFGDTVQDWIRRGILKAYGTTPGLPGGSAIVVDTATIPGRTIVTALPVAGPQSSQPNPARGDVNIPINPLLRWAAGIYADQHNVYLGADANDVENAGDANHPNVTLSQVDDSRFDAGFLLPNTTYYWRVDEVNDAHPDKQWKGTVWSFTTGDYAVVDDFEGYTDDEGQAIYQYWLDGWDDLANGSVVGYIDPPFAEQAVVRSGKQAMPMAYDNTGAAAYSEAKFTFDAAQDWTQHELTTLVVHFHGQAANSPAPLYLKINDTKLSFNNGAAATTMPLWKQWTIPLADTGVNLKSVKNLTLGIEGSGKGKMFFDDIRLYAAAPEVVGPADPGNAGLIALYTMDGNPQDTSGKNYHGVISGDTSYESGYSGQALVFNGINGYVDLPIGPAIASMTDATLATHAYIAGGGAWQRIFDFGTDTTNYMFLTAYTGNRTMRFAIRTPAVDEQMVTAARSVSTGWHHVAVVIDSASMTLRLYEDGVPVADGPTTLLPKDLGATTQNWLGRSQWTADPFFLGLLDDFRIYDRALSEGEVRYLAGDR